MIQQSPKKIFSDALQKHNLKFETINADTKSAVLEAMLTAAQQARNNEDQMLFAANWWLLPELWFSNFVKYLDDRVRSATCKHAQLRANNENYKMYVMKGKPFQYITFSTRQYKYNKKVKVLNSWLTAKDMEEQCCFWCSPKRK